MVPVVEELADVVLGQVRHDPDEVHGDLPGLHGGADPLLALYHGLVQLVVAADVGQDALRRGNVLVAPL